MQAILEEETIIIGEGRFSNGDDVSAKGVQASRSTDDFRKPLDSEIAGPNRVANIRGGHAISGLLKADEWIFYLFCLFC